MFGFLFGTACLAGLFAVVRHGRHFGFGRRCGPRFGARYLFQRVLDRLDTTPGQEKVIRGALEELGEESRSLRRELCSTRTEIATALRSSELDTELMASVFAKHDQLLMQFRRAVMHAITQAHGTLDDRQRARLADMIEAGPWGYAGLH
jgi:uncharacterized membrane protein